MFLFVRTLIAACIAASCLSTPALARSGPFDGKTFQGRIAWSADGNYNDEDDWAASPLALAIFAAVGVKDQVVHFDYNSTMNNTNAEWEKIHETSVLGAAERFGYDKSIFHDCQKNLDGAVASIANAINDSSDDNPLYFVVAGPMEIAYRGIQESDPAKRKFVYVISHSRWNDGYSVDDAYNNNKRDVIPLGITWVQIADQNRYLSTSPFGRPAKDEEWAPWNWMRVSRDPNIQFLWERLRVSTRADASDAGMAYFLMSGDEDSEMEKVRKLLEDHVIPSPLNPRKHIRFEAENFLTLDGFEVEHKNDRAVSHRVNLRPVGPRANMKTPFEQPYMAEAGEYDVEVRYFDGTGNTAYEFAVNDRTQGQAWIAPASGQGWITHTIRGVSIHQGDELSVNVRAASGETGRLDYVQVTYIGPGVIPSSASR
jgi:hypothetical protein